VRIRRLGWLVPLILLALGGGLYTIYRARVAAQVANEPKKPDALPQGVSTKAERWAIAHDDKDGRRKYEVRAESYRALDAEGVFELTTVELDLFDAQDRTKFDRVRSAKAQFNPKEHTMFSEGEVVVTMGMKEGEEPSGKLLEIKGSGVRLDATTGKVTTDQAASFRFDRGEGKSVGAEYDPQMRELHLKSDVDLKWTAGVKPMQIQAGELTYKEAERRVLLGPWSRLIRDNLTMEASTADVRLENGVIRQVDALQAKGVDVLPNRRVEYGADELRLEFDEKGEIGHIAGAKNTRLSADSKAAYTLVRANRVDLVFVPVVNASNELRHANTNGATVVESRPKPQPGKETPATRLLKSEVVEVNLRPGGEDLKSIQTHTPGTMEFLPNGKGQRRRRVDGNRITIEYGLKNAIETFRVVTAATRSEPLDPKKDRPLLTWSKDLLAQFDAEGEMTKLEQWTDFRFEEGIRKGQADRAAIDQKTEIITLEGKARLLDDSGSTEGQRIVMNQKTEEFLAEGQVYSSRIPDKKKKEGSTILTGEEAMQARAMRMTSSQGNKLLRYSGSAVLWQGSDRVKADEIEIRRDEGRFLARGNVFSQFLDTSKEASNREPQNREPQNREAPNKEPQKGSAPVFTVMRAAELDYSDKDRIAVYRGGVQLERPGLKVGARELRAFFVDDGKGGNQLDRALADGQVAIDQEAKGRRRNGQSEHAEYYVEAERIVLEGGQPVVTDSAKGTTKGRKLTILSKEDRTIVEGESSAPAVTRLKKKS
jgi:lipopolysaccharide export system protein LptA